MRVAMALITSAGLILAAPVCVAGETVLFIGNSFTYGQGSAVRFYRNTTVTDLNHEGIGGVPALFKSFADQAGLDYDVSLETRGGAGLDFHLAGKRDVIAAHAWDKVVAHGYSTLDSEKPRDPAKLIATSKALSDLVREKNPKVDLYLTATWSRADQVYPANGAWAGKPIETMASDIRAAYDQAAAGAGAQVIPVGGAWNRAWRTGVADPNPYDGLEAGKLDLWTYDHYHASTHGYYLEALVIFGRITRRDPRELARGECSAFELGLSAAEAAALQQVAFDELLAAGAVAAAAVPASNAEAPRRCAAPR
ncbi:MAG: PEP-CTERM sorting domain-containing protein [Gammaproteobacteria bacterium]